MCISKDSIEQWVQLLSVINYADATLDRPGKGSSCHETVAGRSANGDGARRECLDRRWPEGHGDRLASGHLRRWGRTFVRALI
jgi:hypothetical protein